MFGSDYFGTYLSPDNIYLFKNSIYEYVNHSIYLLQIIKMQKIISQIPQLHTSLAHLPCPKQHDALVHLIRLGLQVSRSYCCKQNNSNETSALHQELNRLRGDIQQLNQVVRLQSQHSCRCCHQGSCGSQQTAVFQKSAMANDQTAHAKTPGKISKEERKYKQACRENIPVQDVPAGNVWCKQNTISFNPFTKRKPFISRHHLDDTGAREALEFPPSSFAEHEVPIKRRSQDYKKHIYQEQVNKEELVKIKEEKGDPLEQLDRTKRDRAISDHTKATSKIKALIDKDRLRFMQKKREYDFEEGFNKYEYSDDGQMEESSMKEESNEHETEHYGKETYPKFYQGNTYSQHFQSSFKNSNQPSSQKSARNRTSSKKEFSRSKNDVSSKLQRSMGEQIRIQHRSQNSSKQESNQKYVQESVNDNRNIDYEQDDDVVSNSSSFSQFSINGSRRKEVGKISRRSHNE